MFQTILYIVGGVIVGAIAALKIIAPKTVTTVDDSVLSRLEDLEALVEKLTGSTIAGSPAPTSPASPPAA